MRRIWILSVVFAALLGLGAVQARALDAWVASQDMRTGQVAINGVDMGCWDGPVSWDFGDGTVVNGWFPQEHVYTDFGRDYVVKLHLKYCDGSSADAEVPVSFVSFTFDEEVLGTPKTLFLNLDSANKATGQVQVGGVDTRPVSEPFTWDFGDGEVLQGWFPQEHTYTDTARNYVVRVTSTYLDQSTASALTLVRFAAPTLDPIELPGQYLVNVPAEVPELGSHFPSYGPPLGLEGFPDEDFDLTPRESLEYVLGACSTIQGDFVNDDLPDLADGFRQLVLKDPAPGGWMYSLWFATPPAMAVSTDSVMGILPYTSLFHELGHNATLNSPAAFFYGGKIDGPANQIYSESMAQIFQHATAYQLINSAPYYGLGEDVVQEIAQNSRASILHLRSAFDTYVDGGKQFRTWDVEGNPWAWYTSAVVAYKFCEHAELSELGYRVPLKRMMTLLQQFDSEMEARYDRNNDTAEADTFRATLLVAALSYAFDLDLRGEFRDLNFPVDDLTWCDLIARVTPVQALSDVKTASSGDPAHLDGMVVTEVWPDRFYAQTPERSSGIRVDIQGHGRITGDVVEVRGLALTDENQEKFVLASFVSSSASQDAPEPLAMPIRTLGGGPFWYDEQDNRGQSGVTGGSGLNNIGLLVRVAGTVTAVDEAEGWYTVSDGSMVTDPDGNAGARVLAAGLALPDAGDTVIVSGASSCVKVDGVIYPAIRTSLGTASLLSRFGPITFL